MEETRLGHSFLRQFPHYFPLRNVTPAMEAGLCDHVWTLEEITGLAN